MHVSITELDKKLHTLYICKCFDYSYMTKAQLVRIVAM